MERNKDMSGVTDLARHIKARDNPSSYTPMFGRIISLPKLVIQLGNNILLDDSDIKSVFDIMKHKRGTIIRNTNTSEKK